MRYYIADCHFFHKSVLTEMDKRGFETVDEMNEMMIQKWNDKVRKNDEVVILGDFSWEKGAKTAEILRRLNGKKFLIKGNHDHYLEDKTFDPTLFEWVKDYAELRDNKRKVVLCHYPIPFYNGQYRRDGQDQPSTYMLHGHIHNTKDQEYLDIFRTYLEKQKRPTIGEGQLKNVPSQMINCFTQFSDYTPLTLDEWIESEKNRRENLGTDITELEEEIHG